MTALLNYQLFLCFRGKDIREGFLSFLVAALDRKKSVKYFVDYQEMRGEVLGTLLKKIEESRIVLVIFSEKFMESKWCADEVVKAMETRGPGKTIIPIFYKVTVEEVENWSFIQEGDKEKHKITNYLGSVYTGTDSKTEADFVDEIIEEVEKTLTILETKDKEKKVSQGEGEMHETTTTTTMPFSGIMKRVKQLQDKLKMDCDVETRVVGVVGMKGIGKTKLAEMFFAERKDKFQRSMYYFKDEVPKKKENDKLNWLLKLFLQNLLKKTKNVTITDKTTHEDVKGHLLETKLLLVLDDLSDKEEIVYLLGDRKWIKRGSKIVIVTSDKSLVEGIVDDTYVVPSLNEKEGLECLSHHAFGDPKRYLSKDEGNLYLTLSRKFVNYARGNPLALTLLGKELWGRKEDQWESILSALEMNPNKNIQDLLNSCYDGLSQPHKDAFLDVTCFFRSQDHKFVTTLVESSCIIKDLADKFLIEISGGRVEMHGLLYNLGKNLASQQKWGLLNQKEIIKALKKKQVYPEGIRGIFLDMSEVVGTKPLGEKAFDGMTELRYVKFYNSRMRFPKSGNINFPDGLEFPLEEVRYLHWLKFPFEELPKDFNPKNLIDLKLPFSHIKQLWNEAKDVTRLKWVDLSHSSNLQDLSGLLGAVNLQRLSLEGCIELAILPEEMMQTMRSLVFLNMRSCKSLKSLPGINIKSLKTLVLSNCSSLKKFMMVSENLEALYLDGTGLKGLPETTIKLQKLVILNMKDCKKLASVPDSLGKLHDLQEVIFSGCSKLQSFPVFLKTLRILLLDGTAIPQVFPSGLNGLSLLRRLCLSRNEVIQTLQATIGQLYHLKCLDLKYCKKLTSVPTLPPNLQCFDAHGCDSLTTVASPLAFLNLTDQINSTLIFSNCNNLEEFSKTCIISYIQRKSQLMSNALNRYNLGSVVASYTESCFPGCEVPECFSHQAYGSVIKIDLARTRNENRIIGVALCAAVSFQDYRSQNSGFLVKCTCEFNNVDGSVWCLSCTVGGTAGPGIEPRKVESDHVFVSYRSLLEIKKQSKEEDKKVRSSTKVSLSFEVVDGAGELVNCEVLKCGFSMVYEPEGTDHDNVSWEVKSHGYPMVDDDSIHDGETSMSSATQQADEMIIDRHVSDDDDDVGQQEEENGNANAETRHDSVSDKNMDDKVTPSISSVEADIRPQCNSGAALKTTPSISLVEVSRQIQPGCNSGVTKNFNGKTTFEGPPSTQKPHETPTKAEINRVVKVERGKTRFSFLQSFIPCLGRKEPQLKPQEQVQET